MPMFDDPRGALNRLQQELLEEEAEYEEENFSEDHWLDEEIAEAKALLGMDEEEEDDPVIYRNYANGYGRQVYAREAYPDAEEEIPADDTKGQKILAFLLLAGILAVAGYWAVVLL